MSGTSRPLAVVLAMNPSQAYYQAIIRGVLHEARLRGSVHFRVDPAGRTLANVAGLRAFDGVIGVLGTGTAAMIRKAGVPAVNVSNADLASPLPRVASDDAAVGLMAADYCLDRGFTHFAFLGMGDRGFSLLRERGFTSRLAQRGFPCALAPRQWVTASRGRVADAAREQALALGGWLAGLPKPLAVFACNDTRARQAIQGCEQMGLQVPEQVAILGVDNDPIECELSGMPLSSIALAGEKVGAAAMQLMEELWRSRNGAPRSPQAELVPPNAVITRQSTDTLAIDEPVVAAALARIRHHAGKRLTVEDVVATAPVSRRVLERLFRKHLGRSIRREVELSCLERARQLLRQTSLPLKEVATAAGFPHAKRMGEVFRREFGASPSDMR